MQPTVPHRGFRVSEDLQMILPYSPIAYSQPYRQPCMPESPSPRFLDECTLLLKTCQCPAACVLTSAEQSYMSESRQQPTEGLLCAMCSLPLHAHLRMSAERPANCAPVAFMAKLPIANRFNVEEKSLPVTPRKSGRLTAPSACSCSKFQSTRQSTSRAPSSCCSLYTCTHSETVIDFWTTHKLQQT